METMTTRRAAGPTVGVIVGVPVEVAVRVALAVGVCVAVGVKVGVYVAVRVGVEVERRRDIQGGLESRQASSGRNKTTKRNLR
jgi:hypothetical protein